MEAPPSLEIKEKEREKEKAPKIYVLVRLEGEAMNLVGPST